MDENMVVALGLKTDGGGDLVCREKRVEREKLSFMYTNIRSIMNNNKLDETSKKAHEEEIDIIGITESWTNEDIQDAEIGILGYNLYRKDRDNKDKSKGGGVLLYINSTLTSTEENNGRYSESLWVEIYLYGKLNLTIGVCYRAPTISNIEEINLFNTMKEMAKRPSIIMGDFNFPDIIWSSMEAGSRGEDFIDLIQDSFLFQHVNVPTRSDSILDLVFSSELDMVKDLNVQCPIAN